ncbi:monocarboxylate transporter family [Plakobranchus ocellatus]|uniref:Monocarboxylate transporter family n=1 Tax=Plakobranchus ocellatus TaxID=259542 RepID=A0AAV4DS29_9GAST|nr:monocarboxylate transporter family [Plakobranchus ocellatus]
MDLTAGYLIYKHVISLAFPRLYFSTIDFRKSLSFALRQYITTSVTQDGTPSHFLVNLFILASMDSIHTYNYACFLLVFLGLGLGMQYFPTIAMIPLYFKKRRSFAMGIGVSGLGIGAFVYPPFLAWLEEQYNWRGAMLIISGLILNVILCGALLRPYKPEDQSSTVEVKDQTTNTSKSADTSSLTESSSESKDSTKDSDSTSSSCLSSENKDEDGSRLEKKISWLKSNQQLIEQDKDNVGEMPILDISKIENWNISRVMSTKSELSDLFILPSGSSKAVTSDISYTDLGFSPGKLYLWQKRTTLTTQTQGDISVTGDDPRFLKDKNTEYAQEKEELSNSFELKDKRGTQIPSKTSEVQPNTQPTVIPPKYVLSQAFSRTAQPTEISPESVTSQTSSQTAQESPISKRRRFKLFANTLSILRNPLFTVYAVSTLLASLTFLMPPVYIVDRAIELGVEKRQAALALSMVGAGNLLGRLLVSFLADHFFDNLVWNGTCLVLSGVATCLSPLCGSNAVLHGVYGFAFGLFIGGHVALFPVIVADLLGLSLLNDGFGILLLFRAVGTAAGTPIAGKLSARLFLNYSKLTQHQIIRKPQEVNSAPGYSLTIASELSTRLFVNHRR